MPGPCNAAAARCRIGTSSPTDTSLWIALGVRLHVCVVDLHGSTVAAGPFVESRSIVEHHLFGADAAFVEARPTAAWPATDAMVEPRCAVGRMGPRARPPVDVSRLCCRRGARSTVGRSCGRRGVAKLPQIIDFLMGFPGFLPGLAVSLVVAVVVSRPAARALQVRRVLAGAVVFSLGIVLSATLTPSPSGLARDISGLGPLEHHRATCDLSRIGPAAIGQYLSLNDTSLNVLMLVPLGFTIGLLPGSRGKTAIVLLACAVPFAVEWTQLVAVPLDRACQSADVSDNLLGLLLGLAAGATKGKLRHQRHV